VLKNENETPTIPNVFEEFRWNRRFVLNVESLIVALIIDQSDVPFLPIPINMEWIITIH
jgi:hypothetical protein